MEFDRNKKDLARKALLDENTEEILDTKLEDVEELPPLLQVNEDFLSHEEIEPLSFDEPEEKEVRPPEEPTQKLSGLKTYEHDTVESLERNKETITKLRAKEYAQNRRPRQEDGGSYDKKIVTIGAVVVLVVVIATISGLFLLQRTEAPVQKEIVPGIISADEQTTISLTDTERQNIINSINEIKEVNEGDSIHELRFEEFAGREATGQDFLETMRTNAPLSLIRSLTGDFMLGAYGKETFIVLQTNSFDQSYAGFLIWEETIAQDIGHLFTDSPQKNSFKNQVIANKDARVTSLGETSLIYSFVSESTVLIASSEQTFRNILNILFSSNIVQ